MGQPYIGEIRIVGFNFAPLGWAECNGQLLSIAQNDALFALIGTTFGGDGQTTFALPDFQGRAALGAGNSFILGEVAGTETETLTVNQIPAHSHPMGASAGAGSSTSPTSGSYATIANGARNDRLYGAASGQSASPTMLSNVGGNQPHDNMGPFLTLRYIIALEGVFPPQN
jgi:microcystin-dependent protein